MTLDLDERAAFVVSAHAWKTVDDRKVEVNASEWDAAVLVARAWLTKRDPETTDAIRRCLEYCATSPQAIRKDIREDAAKVLKQLSG